MLLSPVFARLPECPVFTWFYRQSGKYRYLWHDLWMNILYRGCYHVVVVRKKYSCGKGRPATGAICPALLCACL